MVTPGGVTPGVCQTPVLEMFDMENRTCSCGGVPEFDMGIPRCEKCKLERRRAYGREYSRRGRRAAALRRGDPQSGDPVTVICQWCEASFTYPYRGQTRTKCDGCKKRSGGALRAAWQRAHPDRVRALKRRYNTSLNGQAVTAAYNLEQRYRKYGLSREQFEGLIADGRCAICQTAEPGGKTGAWHVDHDHTCCPGSRSCGGCVRGVLCANCNLTLGHAKDDPALLRAAADYVERHRAARNQKEIHA